MKDLNDLLGSFKKRLEPTITKQLGLCVGTVNGLESPRISPHAHRRGHKFSEERRGEVCEERHGVEISVNREGDNRKTTSAIWPL